MSAVVGRFCAERGRVGVLVSRSISDLTGEVDALVAAWRTLGTLHFVAFSLSS